MSKQPEIQLSNLDDLASRLDANYGKRIVKKIDPNSPYDRSVNVDYGSYPDGATLEYDNREHWYLNQDQASTSQNGNDYVRKFVYERKNGDLYLLDEDGSEHIATAVNRFRALNCLSIMLDHLDEGNPPVRSSGEQPYAQDAFGSASTVYERSFG